MYAWATKRPQCVAINDVDVGEKMAINIYQWCRDICSWILVNGPNIKLGGPGQIVQIDESVFTHQGKVCNVCTLYKRLSMLLGCVPTCVLYTAAGVI